MPAGRPPNFKEGLSIVELLISISILAFISLMVASVYLAHFRLFSNQSTNIDVASQNKIALDEITNTIRQASIVTQFPYWLDNVINCYWQPVLGYSKFNTNQYNIILALWPLDSNGIPKQPFDSTDASFDHIAYCVDNQTAPYKLIKYTQPATTCATAPCSSRQTSYKILATNLATIAAGDSGLVLTYFDQSGGTLGSGYNATYQVQIQLKTSAQSFDKKQTFETVQTAKAKLRNK